MNYINRIILIWASLFFFLGNGWAADDKDIVVLSFNHGDSVSLRWAPGSEALFQRSVKSGYLVQRRAVGEKTWKSISPVLRPASKEQFSVMEAINPDAVPLKEIFYPSSDRNAPDEAVSNDPYEGKLESIPGETSIEESLLYMMALFSCDINKPVAEAAALLYVDKKVDKTARYQYRVIFADDENAKKVNVSSVDVDMSVKTVLPTPQDFKGDFEERFAHFEWSVAPFTGYYSAYNVERSTDGVNFKPLRERPFVQAYTDAKLSDLAVFRDTFPTEDGTFYYRMAGYSPFGFYGPYSKVVKGEPKFNFQKLSVKVDTVIVGKKSEEIRWSFDKKYENKIKGFKISRTPDYKTFSYETNELIPANKRSFTSQNRYDRTQYYAVIAIGVNDTPQKPEEKQSPYYLSFRADTIPPAMPTGLKAVMDSSGAVKISWDPNKEPDILGYQLFISNSGNEMEYYNVTDTVYPLTSYVDSLPLNTLTNVAYYRVNAVDRNYNRSKWSDAVKLIKIDTVPPVPVVFKFLKQPKENIIVEWENSPSTDLDRMELYRQVDDTGMVRLIQTIDLKKKKKLTKFEDKEQFPGQNVQYFMSVYDEVGNVSQSHSDRMLTKGERPGCIGDLKAVLIVTEDQKEIRLDWNITSNEVIKRYIVYRKKDDGQMVDIALLKPNQLYFVDQKIAIGSTYKYIVRPISSERVCPAVYSEPIYFEGNNSHK